MRDAPQGRVCAALHTRLPFPMVHAPSPGVQVFILTRIRQGEQPSTFLLGGITQIRRVGLALEQLLARQRGARPPGFERRGGSAGGPGRAYARWSAGGRLQPARSDLQSRFQQLSGQSGVATGTALYDIIRDSDVIEPIRAALNQAKAQVAEVNAPDRKKQLQLTAVPITQTASPGVVAVFHDVSRLKQADEIRRDFVANVSHELRTPLSIFHGNLETLLEAGDLDENETRHIYEVMKRHSDRLNLLVNDLLSLARLESKEVNFASLKSSCPSLLEEVTRDWKKRLAGKIMRLYPGSSRRLSMVHANQRQLGSRCTICSITR